MRNLMSRFNSIATLISVAITITGGEPVETETRTDVYCNIYKMGAKTWFQAKSAGLHADSEIEIRTCEYNGQQRVELDDIEYEIERVANNGEFTRLTLKNRASNV